MGFKISRARMDADNGRVDNANFKQYGETTVSAGTSATYTVNLATGKAAVEYDPAEASLTAMKKSVDDIGY